MTTLCDHITGDKSSCADPAPTSDSDASSLDREGQTTREGPRMGNGAAHLVGLEPEVAAFIEELLDRAAAIRLPELVERKHPEALYWVPDRHGVTTVALRTPSLTEEQLVAIMTYRLAQYVMANQLDPVLIYTDRLTLEPLSMVSTEDVHMMAIAADSGEVLAYGTFKALHDGANKAFCDDNRALFPVEEIFGPGVFQRCRILPDLPITKIREAGRLMRSHRHQALDELATRAPVEVLLAAFRLASGPLLAEIAACIGDIELNVAKKNQDFFQLPTVVIRGVVPYAHEGSYGFFNYQYRTRYPYAFLCSDIQTPRLDAIESALELPGAEGVLALLALKNSATCPRSSLEPPGGLPPLDDAVVPQQGVPMAARRQLLDVGEWLRGTRLFHGLSVAEAAVLGTFMERCTVEAGAAVVRQGEHGDDLYVIESGTADVQVTTQNEQRLTVQQLGPGDYFGEIALVTGSERTADVVAMTPMTLLRLSHEAYARYLAQMVEVEGDLTRTALTRTHETLRKMREPMHEDLAAAFREVLPPEAIIGDRATIARQYGRNVTALRREIPLVLRPTTEAQVGRIVAIANARRIPLYPFSTGKNWGLGSKLPVVDGCVVVDLSGMRRIVAVDAAFGYAIIEPGVTQAALADHLAAHHPELTLNLTGSYALTSIVGNVLERGDGASARVHDLLGVRGILGSGEPFEVGGCWRYVGTDRPSHVSRFVAGPDLVGLFAQSNFGIVTQMAFRLIHKPERRYLVWGVAADADLERLVDTIDHFGRQGAINRGSVNIGYENRFVQAQRTLGGGEGPAPGDQAVWNFYVLVTGTARTMDALAAELRDAFGAFCRQVETIRVDAGVDPARSLPAFLHPLARPLMGVPDAESIKLIYHLTGTPVPDDPADVDPDQTPFGMKCYIPVVPHRGSDARRAAAIVSAVGREFETNVKLSFFGDGRTLITVHFRSDDPAQVTRAAACERALWDRMNTAGFPPYRVAIDQMERLAALDPATSTLVGRLKSALDPNGIISPGRYAPV